MRKRLLILIIFFIVIILYLLSYIFKKEHQYNYDFVVDDVKYKVEEKYNYNKGVHNYDFVIEDNNKHIFSFSYGKDLNKKKGIIKKIIRYEKNNLVCIIPKYIKDDIGNIYCNKKSNTYSYSYLNNKKDKDFKEIVKKIKKDGYYSKDLNVSDKVKKKGKVSYYLKNIPIDYRFIMWNYTGINIVSRDGIETKKLVDKNDMYENEFSTMIGKYYLFLDTTTTNKLSYYNVLNMRGSSIKNKKENFTGDYIILGTFNKKLYFIDTDKYIEYTLNPYKKKLEKVGEEKKGYITIKDRTMLKIETSDMKRDPDKYKFVSKVEDESINSKYDAKDIYYYNDFYYFRDKDGIFYRSNSKYKNKPTYLFKLDNVNYWSIVNNNILIVTDKYLYFYNDDYGVKKIIKNDEFKYNFNNICLIFDVV